MDLRRVDLNLLVAFDLLMTERSVTRAAERLSIGQPAMSATLARLRRLFGDPLLVRDGRGLTPTPLAETLAGPVHDLLTRTEQVLAQRNTFDPATAERTFRIIANDFLTQTFLHPLLARLTHDAPGLRLHISPTGDHFGERLRRNEVHLLIIPREAFDTYRLYPHEVLFTDRYVVAADRDHPDLGDTISLEEFTTLPYLATSSANLPSLAEMQLDFLGIPRNLEVTTGFGMAPFLLHGTRLIMLVHESYAHRVQGAAGIRILEPPIPNLQPITETMIWTPRTDADPAHQWLRQQLRDLAGLMPASWPD